MKLSELFFRARACEDVPGGPRLVEQWLQAVSATREPGADEAAARWRGSGRLSGDEVARYALWHRLRLTATYQAAREDASPSDLDRVRAEAAERAAEFETHLRWMRQRGTE
ncbi:hypothetical protein [Streptacidiphilus sp. P02-A3a]|uniref:hypothetical protein n=1 Tax=Streptacidiphilus sp. P02-A3a TaxID=2704468 RepID=UPI0015FD7ABA|nr:hypothetical protein [Streptacidiphilus sp. P02-A3a]QMU70520.1 hypothetical protein GXP74_22270 [Streptacidiphilus sp. P02-A3a]